MQPKYLYEFGPFRLSTVERLLLRGGEVVPLTPKVFDVLALLVERNGHLLEREELLSAVWTDSFVEEANLTVSISALRKALGEQAGGQQYIETVPKRGYRFVASVRELPSEVFDLSAQGRATQRYRAFQVPPLPSHFIPRLEVSETIKTRILTYEPASKGTLIINAIHGLAGSGKTTLATALAHNSDVRERFSSGILWSTLGQEPDLLPILNCWLAASGAYAFHSTVQAAAAQFRSVLQGKAVLLVLDDVWDASHVRNLLVGDPSQVIITTRRADVADDVGATLWRLDPMTPEQSLRLLSIRLGILLDAAGIDDAKSVAKAVGHLPLALELVASRVARGISWRALLSAIEDEIGSIEALENPRRRRKGHIRLEASFNLSLDALRREDESAWRAFAWLGVLPDDVAIAAPMAATLWGTDESDASRILELLWSDALLLPNLAVTIGDSTWPAYRLHDLLHDHARRLLTREKPQGLNLTLREASAALLDRYRGRDLEHGLSGPCWQALPNDGYIQAHLVWHLERADRIDEIHRLLSAESNEGTNAWFITRNRSGDIAGFLQDVARAWQLAEEESSEQIRQRKPSTAVGLEVRYALISTSINSLALNIPPQVLSEFVSRKLWTIDQALAYTRRIPDSEQRVKSLLGIASFVCRQEQETIAGEVVEILNEAKENQGCWFGWDLWGIVECLAKLGFIEEALQLARTEATGRASSLLKIFPWLPESARKDVLPEILEAIRGESEKNETGTEPNLLTVWNMSELAQYLSEPLKSEVVKEGLTEARAIGRSHRKDQYSESEGDGFEEVESVTAMARFLPHLTEPLKTETVGELLANARAIKHKPSRARAMADSIEYLPREIKSEVLQEALATARAVKNAKDRAWLLGWLMAYLSEPLKGKMLKHALRAVERIRDDRDEPGEKNRALAHLAQYFSYELALECTDGLIGSNHEWAADWLLSELCERLAELGKVDEAAQLVKSIGNEKQRQAALAQLAPVLPDPLLLEISAASPAINDDKARGRAVMGLACYLPKECKKPALLSLQSLPDRDDLTGNRAAKRLQNLIPHLPESLMSKAVALAIDLPEFRSDEGFAKMDMLDVLLSRMVEYKQPEKTLPLARSFRWENNRLEALTKVMPHLEEPLKTEVLQEALALIQVENSKPERALLQAQIAHLLPEPTRTEKLQEAFDTARTIPTPQRKRADALASIAPYLTKEQLHQALAIAWISENVRVYAAVGLAPYLEEPKRAEVIREVLLTAAWRSEEARINATVDLVPYLEEPKRAEVIRKVIMTAASEEIWYAVSALPEIIPYASEPVLIEMVPLLKSCEQTEPNSLAKLAIRLSEFGHFEEAIDLVRAMTGQKDKAQALTELTPNLPISLFHEVMVMGQAINLGANPFARCTVLAGLAPYMPKDEAIESLRDALNIAREYYFDVSREELGVKVVAALSALPAADLYPLWRETLHVLAQRTRGDLLTDISWLSRLITQLGGSDAAVESFRAIQGVSRWWA